MNRRKTLAIVGVLVAALLIWYFFGREETRMLRAARNVRSYSEAVAFGSKYNAVPLKWDIKSTKRTYQYTYLFKVGSLVQRHHAFGWSFDEKGQVQAYGRTTENKVLWREYWTFEDAPPISNKSF